MVAGVARRVGAVGVVPAVSQHGRDENQREAKHDET